MTQEACLIDGCDEQRHWLDEWCRYHGGRVSHRLELWSVPLPVEPVEAINGRCGVGGCGRPVHGKGYCSSHLNHARRYGEVYEIDPIGSGVIELTTVQAERFWTYVDRSGGVESCWLWGGGGHPYGCFNVGRTSRQAHCIAWTLAHGPIPEGLVVDHLCAVKLCVNPAHLEPVTHAENLRRGSVPHFEAVAQ